MQPHGYLSFTDMDYLFGHYSGILFASTVFVIIYSTVQLNKPKVYPKVILPGLVSGIMWGMVMCKSDSSTSEWEWDLVLLLLMQVGGSLPTSIYR